MNTGNLNPRMTIIVVFAFLFIVALFLTPGGAADQATEQLSDVARTAAAKAPTPAPTAAAPKAWFAADGEDLSAPPPPPAPADAAPMAAAADAPPVVAKAPPQGADFPDSR